ncbi:hypothetical protein D9611_003401 [Ephemerocybe angulata]|uniref:Proteasome maturation factor UMP1 n=2 Tax=Ephemerocybe angulata TaxID=980116 RepID=A0A8H6IIY8_9AGAR|nr:hypothetical protein D9611_003401 [Tulosesus angulatus]KAF6766435.1 proteasome maturation factor UMP1 [Tulosesus angulatus]
MSLRIVPANAQKSASVQDTAGSFGLHDTLQYGPRSIAVEVKSQGTLKERLENWEETQDNLKLNLQRNAHGIHLPMRVLMERKLVTSHPNFMGTSNLHLDVLMGRDETIEPADVFLGMESSNPLDIRKEFEKRYKA